MNKYTEANRRLATALGWTDIVEVGGALLGTPPDGAPGSRGQAMVPDWCGDWRECGPLMVGPGEDAATLRFEIVSICAQELEYAK